MCAAFFQAVDEVLDGVDVPTNMGGGGGRRVLAPIHGKVTETSEGGDAWTQEAEMRTKREMGIGFITL